jgi:protein TonB
VFENRNKEYGAYTLRKYYERRLTVALCVSMLLAAVGYLLLVKEEPGISDAHDISSPIPDVVVRTLPIPEISKPPEPQKAIKPQQLALPVAQQQYTQIRITTDPVSATDVPTQTDLGDVLISNKTSTGVSPSDLPVPPEPTTAVGQTSESKTVAAPTYAEPQFPGGAAAWMRFLSRNLQAPALMEPGEMKTVLVRFLVSEDGTVTGFEVVQSGGAAFDNEVIRVLKKMPKWKPALRNGQPTAVPFTQPVTFISTGD